MKQKIILLGSVSDHGTRSITETYEIALQPDAVLNLTFGLKRMGLRRLWQAVRFVLAHRSSEVCMVCLHRAPVLIAGLLPVSRKARWIGVIDSNETYPFGLQGLAGRVYDQIYKLAFRRLNAVYTPWGKFADYYHQRGVTFHPCQYPLPFPQVSTGERPENKLIRVLFVGADYVRKGGDLLLAQWSQQPPAAAALTFVSPQAPDQNIPGVTFRRDIRAGTPEQLEIYQTHDLLVLPSRLEPYGFVLLEAVNHGMCAITTESAGAAEMVRSFGGIAAPSPEAAVAAALELIANPEELSRRRHHCREYLPAYQKLVEASLREMTAASQALPNPEAHLC